VRRSKKNNRWRTGSEIKESPGMALHLKRLEEGKKKKKERKWERE